MSEVDGWSGWLECFDVMGRCDVLDTRFEESAWPSWIAKEMKEDFQRCASNLCCSIQVFDDFSVPVTCRQYPTTYIHTRYPSLLAPTIPDVVVPRFSNCVVRDTCSTRDIWSGGVLVGWLGTPASLGSLRADDDTRYVWLGSGAHPTYHSAGTTSRSLELVQARAEFSLRVSLLEPDGRVPRCIADASLCLDDPPLWSSTACWTGVPSAALPIPNDALSMRLARTKCSLPTPLSGRPTPPFMGQG